MNQLPASNLYQSEAGLELSAQDLHIHYLDVRRFTGDHYAEAERNMSSEERARAQKFVCGKENYISSRWLPRNTLARYLGLAPAAMEFSRMDKGKPYLAKHEIHFSMSHSGHRSLLAVSRSEFVGVDIQVVTLTSPPDLISIAKNYYHPQEFVRLQALTGSAQNDYFYRLWTLKEAFFKATGTGISAGLKKIAFELADGRIHCRIAASLNEDSNNWQFRKWMQGTQDYCALAYKSHHPLQVNWLDALSISAFP